LLTVFSFLSHFRNSLILYGGEGERKEKTIPPKTTPKPVISKLQLKILFYYSLSLFSSMPNKEAKGKFVSFQIKYLEKFQEKIFKEEILSHSLDPNITVYLRSYK